MLGDLFGGLVQPILVRRQLDDFHRREPLGRIRRGITQWRQFVRRHQNLDVMLREAEQLRRGGNIEASREILRRPRRQGAGGYFIRHTGLS